MVAQLFAREVEKLYSLKHQNVLRVHGYILDDVVGFGLVCRCWLYVQS